MSANQIVGSNTVDGLDSAIVNHGVYFTCKGNFTFLDADSTLVGCHIGVECLMLNSIVICILHRTEVSDRSSGSDAQGITGRQSEHSAVTRDMSHSDILIGHCVARISMCLTIIRPAVSVGIDDHCGCIVGYFQSTEAYGNIVVGSFCI